MTRTEALEKVAEAARRLLETCPSEGRSNRGAYVEHAMLCDVTRGIGACDCGFVEWEQAQKDATERLAALAALESAGDGTVCAECGCARGCHGSGGCTGEDGMGCDCPAYAPPRSPASTGEGGERG